jgi:hypothetical protein
MAIIAILPYPLIQSLVFSASRAHSQRLMLVERLGGDWAVQAEYRAVCMGQNPAYGAIVGDDVKQRVIDCSHHDQTGVVRFGLSQNFDGRIAVNNLDIDLCA